MTTNGKRVVNLNALLGEQGQVELDGQTYAVRPINGRGYQALQAMERTKKVDLDQLYQVAADCLPELGLERVLNLTIPQVQAIIATASAGVAEVEAAAPKEGPTTDQAGAPTPPSA